MATQRKNNAAVSLAFAAAAVVACTKTASAVYWNNDPNTATFGVASAAGLTDKPLQFANDYRIFNDANSTRGTTILLNSEWALTVHHVVQSSAGYNPITTPNEISVYVDGVGGYFADQLFVPSDGSEIALVHLRGGVNGAQNLVPDINTTSDENGRLVEIGGYGYYGYVDTTAAGGTTVGTSNTGENFNRAYNTIQGFNSLGQIQITENHDATVAADNVLEGIAGPGDSGGPMFAFYGTDFATQQNNPADWKLVGLTATSAATTSASWGQSSQYTRISNYAGWIASTMASLSTPGPTTTAAWVQDSGNLGMYDTGGNKMSVSNSTAAPVVHAKFGPGGAGYTMNQIGQKITMTANVDTPLAWASIQFRFGMFNDVNGTIPGNVAGGTPWQGYLVANSAENDPRPVYEKGPNGGGVGSWWSLVSPNTGNGVGAATQATGSFTSATTGNDSTPAGSYNLSLTYTRVASGIEIDWSMIQVTDAAEVLNATTGFYQHNPTAGVYSYSGSVIDASPASANWTYDELGFFLYGAALNTTNSTIIVSNINVSFTPEPSSLALAAAAFASLLARRRRRRASPPAAIPHSPVYRNSSIHS